LKALGGGAFWVGLFLFKGILNATDANNNTAPIEQDTMVVIDSLFFFTYPNNLQK
jgi:hypothetical protein